MTREVMESEAMERVCPCWFYDLGDVLEDTPDRELEMIIQNPMVCHYESQKHSPVPVDEFIDELKQCPAYNGQDRAV